MNRRACWAIVAVALAMVGCGTDTESVPDPDAGPGRDGSASVDATRLEPPRSTDAAIRELGACEVPPGWGANTECKRLEVACRDLPAAEAAVVIARPPDGVRDRGTIFFGTGGVGKEHYLKMGPSASALTMLVERGYTVIDRRWVPGWFGPGSEGLGIGTPSCRGASLLEWAHEEVHRGVGFCATGNSGGSAELAYALSWWGAGDILDLVVLTGGPPLSRIDIGCLGDEALSGWRDRCAEWWTELDVQCPPALQDPQCTLTDRELARGPLAVDAAYAVEGGPTDRCTGSDTGAEMLLREDSILAPGVLLSYPDTEVRFLHGRADCTEAVTLGRLYHEALETESSLEFLDGVRHSIRDSEDGMRRLFEVLVERCGPG